MSAGPNNTRVVIVEGIRSCLDSRGERTCCYECGGEHPSGKMTSVEVYDGELVAFVHYSKTEGGARRWAQRFARKHGLRVET